ncbi:hypothetical protein Scep_022564 [Stephania cephalantha]|uniref:Uncharacterized protein n=1 Tax=Stephania cephalantha TaxID=152367 RepID=A0AAP0I2D2_9MAGN
MDEASPPHISRSDLAKKEGRVVGRDERMVGRSSTPCQRERKEREDGRRRWWMVKTTLSMAGDYSDDGGCSGGNGYRNSGGGL